MQRWVSEARDRWPLLAFGAADFRRHLDALGRSTPVFPADTYLAAACAAGDAAAMRVLDEELVARVPAMIRRIDASPAFGADVCQQLRIRVLVSEGDAAPRIARYTGDVPLSAWLRVIALRLALNAKRGVRSRGEEPSADDETSLDDPEYEHLRAQYREPFRQAFESALGELPKDDRTVLRLHYVDGLNIEGIGRVFQVHRATVARWLVRIRQDVLTRAKALLAERLGAEIDEAGSVIGVLGAEIDLTLSRVLSGHAAT